MPFIQIIEYETDRPEEIDKLMAAQAAQALASGDQAPFTRMEVTRDRENPRHFLAVIEFSSYQGAMENSTKPETQEFAKKLGALMTTGPTYHNMDVVRTAP